MILYRCVHFHEIRSEGIIAFLGSSSGIYFLCWFIWKPTELYTILSCFMNTDQGNWEKVLKSFRRKVVLSSLFVSFHTKPISLERGFQYPSSQLSYQVLSKLNKNSSLVVLENFYSSTWVTLQTYMCALHSRIIFEKTISKVIRVSQHTYILEIC